MYNSNNNKQSNNLDNKKYMNTLQNNPRFSHNNPLESVQEHSIESDNTFRMSQERFNDVHNILQNRLNSGGKSSGDKAGRSLMNGYDKSPYKYEKKGLNNTFLNQIEDLAKDELIKICMDERISQENLNMKLQQKEKLIGQMRNFHNEICSAFEDAQTELQRVKEQKGVLKEKEKEIEKLQNQFIEIEKIQSVQDKENKDLKKQIQEKQFLLQQIRDESIKIENENDYIRKKNENLEKRCMVLERENVQLRGFQQDESQIIQDFKFKVDQLEEDNATMSITIENNEKDMGILLEERQELLRKLENYEIALENSERQKAMRIDEILRDQQKINEEKINNALIDQQYKYHQKEQKHKKQIMKLSQQVQVLDNELKNQLKSSQISQNFNKQSNTQSFTNSNQLKNQTLSQQLKHSQMRISNLEQALQEVATNYNQNDIKENALDSDNLVQALFKEFKPQNLTDLYNQIKEQKKLSECLQSMVLNCHPKGFFENEKSQCPSLKQSWKWLKKILEEYMQIKRNGGNSQQNLASQASYQSPRFNSVSGYQNIQQEGTLSFGGVNSKKSSKNNNNSNIINQENEEILLKIQDFLNVESKNQILNTLADVLIEKEIANRLFQKLKKELGCEWVQNYEEFENTLNRKSSQDEEFNNEDNQNNDNNDNNVQEYQNDDNNNNDDQDQDQDENDIEQQQSQQSQEDEQQYEGDQEQQLQQQIQQQQEYQQQQQLNNDYDEAQQEQEIDGEYEENNEIIDAQNFQENINNQQQQNQQNQIEDQFNGIIQNENINDGEQEEEQEQESNLE